MSSKKDQQAQDMGYFFKPSGGQPDKMLSQWDKGNQRQDFRPYERHIKSLNQRIMTTYRLPIAIEHAYPKWPLVDYRKKELKRGRHFF